MDGRVQYPTAEEVAYPELLCQRLAERFRDALLRLGAIDVETMEQQQQVEQPSMHRILMDALPRGKKYKPLVSEYGSYTTVVHSDSVDEKCFPVATGC